MKTVIKLGIIILLMALFGSSSHADCSKSEVMKLIDKGFSKTEISSICGLARKTSTLKREADKWITPSSSTCSSNGGELYKGMCSANWQDAQTICSVSGGRLPNIYELKKVITDCGGVVDADIENIGDPKYQSCYRKKGFSASDYYWSSSVYVSDTGGAWLVLFKDSHTRHYYKTRKYYVRCVRGRQ